MNQKKAKQQRKEVRKITQTEAMRKFNQQQRKSHLKVQIYQTIFFVYTVIIIFVVLLEVWRWNG